MDNYVTGAVIRRLREAKRMTQEELAQTLFVSSKAVSKWESAQWRHNRMKKQQRQSVGLPLCVS